MGGPPRGGGARSPLRRRTSARRQRPGTACAAARPSAAATRLLGRRPPRLGRRRKAAKPLTTGLSVDDGAAPRRLFPWLPRRALQDLLKNRPTARRSQKEPRPGGGTEISGADAAAHARWAPQPGGEGAGRGQITHAPVPSLPLAAALPGPAWRARGCGIHRQSTRSTSPRPRARCTKADPSVECL